MTQCLPARFDVAALEQAVRAHEIADAAQARQAQAEHFGFAGWGALYAEVERRAVLNARDVAAAQARILADPEWATADLTGWCDQRCGAAPLNYMAMLRFDAGPPRTDWVLGRNW